MPYEGVAVVSTAVEASTAVDVRRERKFGFTVMWVGRAEMPASGLRSEF